jgi:hypothetical protein
MVIILLNAEIRETKNGTPLTIRQCMRVRTSKIMRAQTHICFSTPRRR